MSSSPKSGRSSGRVDDVASNSIPDRDRPFTTRIHPIDAPQTSSSSPLVPSTAWTDSDSTMSNTNVQSTKQRLHQKRTSVAELITMRKPTTIDRAGSLFDGADQAADPSPRSTSNRRNQYHLQPVDLTNHRHHHFDSLDTSMSGILGNGDASVNPLPSPSRTQFPPPASNRYLPDESIISNKREETRNTTATRNETKPLIGVPSLALYAVDAPTPKIQFTPTEMVVQPSRPHQSSSLMKHLSPLVRRIVLPSIDPPPPPTIPRVFLRDRDGKKKVTMETKIALTAVNTVTRPVMRPYLPTKTAYDLYMALPTLMYIICVALHFVHLTSGDVYNIIIHLLEFVPILGLIPWHYHHRRHNELAFNVIQLLQLLFITFFVALTGTMLFWGFTREYMFAHWHEVGSIAALWGTCFGLFFIALMAQMVCIILESRSMYEHVLHELGEIECAVTTYMKASNTFHDIYRASLTESERHSLGVTRQVERARDELERELRNPRHDVVVGDALLFEDHQELQTKYDTLQQEHDTMRTQLHELQQLHSNCVETENALREEFRFKFQEHAITIQQLKNAHTRNDSTTKHPIDREEHDKYLRTLEVHQESLKSLRDEFAAAVRASGLDSPVLERELTKLRAAHDSSLELLTRIASQERAGMVADHDFRFRVLEDKHRALQLLYRDLRHREEAEAKDPNSPAAARGETEKVRQQLRTSEEEVTRLRNELQMSQDELHRMEEVVILLENLLDTFETAPGPGIMSTAAASRLKQQMNEAMARVIASAATPFTNAPSTTRQNEITKSVANHRASSATSSSSHTPHIIAASSSSRDNSPIAYTAHPSATKGINSYDSSSYLHPPPSHSLMGTYDNDLSMSEVLIDPITSFSLVGSNPSTTSSSLPIGFPRRSLPQARVGGYHRAHPSALSAVGSTITRQYE